MKFFKISYKQAKKRFSLTIAATHRAESIKLFRTKNLGILLDIKEVSEPFTMRFERLKNNYNNPIKNRHVKDEPYIAFLDQLSTMLDAGIPINSCLAECIVGTSDKMISYIFADVLRNIESGQSLSNSVARYKNQLGTLSLSMFELGEQTGTISESIRKLSAILQQIYENRQKLKKATRYPIFVLVAMGIAFTVVITFVVPQFKLFFDQSAMELPFPTKILLWVEYAIRTYGPYIFAAAIGFVAIFKYVYSKNPTIRLRVDQYILKIYIIGKVRYYAMIGRFIYLFNVLSETGVPMIQALQIATDIVENDYMKQELQKISFAIGDGRSLAVGFGESKQFESMILQMVKTGENSGSLGLMLDKVNYIYSNRYNYIVDNIATMIEPIMIGAIAGFVLVLALGIFMPMWSMIDIAG